jgi:hypothetical protein
VKKLKVMAAVALVAAIFGASAVVDKRVPGESADRGLGELERSYASAQFEPAAVEPQIGEYFEGVLVCGWCG